MWHVIAEEVEKKKKWHSHHDQLNASDQDFCKSSGHFYWRYCCFSRASRCQPEMKFFLNPLSNSDPLNLGSLTWFLILTDLDLGLDTEKASLSLGLPGLESSGAEMQVTVRGRGAAACIGDSSIVSVSSIDCFSGSSDSMLTKQMRPIWRMSVWKSEIRVSVRKLISHILVPDNEENISLQQNFSFWQQHPTHDCVTFFISKVSTILITSCVIYLSPCSMFSPVKISL